MPNPLPVQGDNDPVDVVELGGQPLAAGSVHCVRALGAYAMIDEGELGARRALSDASPASSLSLPSDSHGL